MKFPQLGPVSRPQRPHSPAGWLWGGGTGDVSPNPRCSRPNFEPGQRQLEAGVRLQLWCWLWADRSTPCPRGHPAPLEGTLQRREEV